MKTLEQYIKDQIEYNEMMSNMKEFQIDSDSNNGHYTNEQMKGLYKGRIEMLYAIKHYYIDKPQYRKPDVIKSVCVSCDEETETHEVCMKCISKMIADNQQTVL